MKRNRVVILLVSLLSMLSLYAASTKVDVKQLKADSMTVPRLFAYISGTGLVFVDIAGMTMDTTTTPPTLRVNPPLTTVTPLRNDFPAVGNNPSLTLTLPVDPGTRPMLLYRNGVLQRVAEDYNIVGVTITLTSLPITGDLFTAVLL